jgi:hypothetical protein
VEIVAVLLVALAIFLLVERMQIRQILLDWLRQGASSLGNLGDTAWHGAVDAFQSVTLSDLLGCALLLSAVILLVWRVRWRLTNMPRFTENRCPQCGSGLRRIHRRRRDRFLSVFVPVRRCQCRNPECRWRGLRVRRPRHA